MQICDFHIIVSRGVVEGVSRGFVEEAGYVTGVEFVTCDRHSYFHVEDMLASHISSHTHTSDHHNHPQLLCKYRYTGISRLQINGTATNNKKI